MVITSGVMWCDVCMQTPYGWLNKFYGFYTAAVVGIISGHGLIIHTDCGN